MEDLIIELFDKFPTLTIVLAGLTAAHALALFVVNLTPTPKDNLVVKKFYKVIEYVAGIVSDRTKDK